MADPGFVLATQKTKDKEWKETCQIIYKKLTEELPWFKKNMGSHYKGFVGTLAWAVLEHRVTLDEITTSLKEKSGEIIRLNNRITEAYKTQTEKVSPQGIFTIIASSYVAGYLYGIDPVLLVAIARTENRFKTKGASKKGAIGAFQVVPNSSLMLDLHPQQPGSKRRLEIVNEQIAACGGKTIRKLARLPKWEKITDSKNGKLDDRDARKILEYPVHCAIWAARTLMMKGYLLNIENKNAHTCLRKEDMGKSEIVKKWLASYNGPTDAEEPKSFYTRMLKESKEIVIDAALERRKELARQYGEDVYNWYLDYRKIARITQTIPKVN